MTEKLCLATIKTKYESLTDKEKQVADYILNHTDKIVGLSISELSEQAGVVKSVVVRCCQSLGFTGYAQFKISLAAELAKNKEFNYVPYINRDDTAGEVLDKIFSANVKTLHDTAAGIDREALKEIVDILYKAEHIYVYAIGTSACIAEDFAYRLMQLGFTSFAYTDVDRMKISTLNIREGDVAFGISNSGSARPTVDALRLAGEKGAVTVGLTSYPDSLLARESEHSLVIYTDEIQYPIEAISSRIAHISVLDAITVSLSAKEYDKAVERAAQTRTMIDSGRY